MINAASNDIVIHVPMDQAVVRVGGIEVKGLRPSRGFAWVESSDGVYSPITNPFYTWIIDAIYNGPVGGTEFNFVFVFDGGSPRGPDLDSPGEMDLGV